MISCLNRLGLIAGTVLSTAALFSLCGCTRMTGFVMNESGQAFYQRGNYTMAAREFHKAVVEDPTNPHYLYNLAAANAKRGEYMQAEQIYRQAISIDPSHQPSYHGLAAMMVEQGRVAEAEQMLTTWAGAQPYSAEAQIEMAWLQQKNGNYQAAESSLMQALRINPRHDHAIAQLGQVYEAQGRPQEAMAMYERAVITDPTRYQVQSRLAGLEERYPHLKNPQAPTMMAGVPAGAAPWETQSTQMAAWNAPMMGGAPQMAAAPMMPMDYGMAAYPQMSAQPHMASYPSLNGYPQHTTAWAPSLPVPTANYGMPYNTAEMNPQYQVAAPPAFDWTAQQQPMMMAPQTSMSAPQIASPFDGMMPQHDFQAQGQISASPNFGWQPQMSQALPEVQAF